ncbi:carbohydrate ABC transporter permease [Metabacillus halosaccharovorans]|uniref:carbohydrate ABC transporter permease n=1 Tax=Metabacillus halosaccharovorans TaxID=930124 RepID=UPI001C1F51FE|nr:carbohydrate ABC transporter permease [Metabacillus halosaccharovorans]MBU7595732.1 carbohydrate ABC transporter permease [Metabacillus halosaccharovorans]
MVGKPSISRKAFLFFNYMFLILLAMSCLFPVVHMLAMSFSSNAAVAAGQVSIFPKGFNLSSYQYIIQNPTFIQSFLTSIYRVVIGSIITMTVTVLAAYPLSKSNKKFKMRTFYSWFFVFTMIFNGGLIPTFMVVKATGITDSIWALVLPCAVNVFNLVLMLNFFRSLPEELEESAQIDGAGPWRTLWSIYLPISKPVMATVLLFTVVFHWNSWFDGLIYMNSPENYPLQTYLRSVIVSRNIENLSGSDLSVLSAISDRTVLAAQLFISIIPVLCLYPFLQKYFVKGIVLGSVKG